MNGFRHPARDGRPKLRKNLAGKARDSARTQHLGTAEVRFPTKQGYSQLCYDVGQTVASGAAGQFPDAVFEFVDDFVRHLQPGSVPADCKSQKLAFGWAIYRAFQRIHCESQCVADGACHAGHHPLARCFAFDQDVAVVGVMGKTVAAPFQFPVEFIQYDIRQHRRQRAALRYALCRGLYTAVHTDSGLEIAVGLMRRNSAGSLVRCLSRTMRRS